LRFLVFVEGKTEHQVIGAFMRAWLNGKLEQNVGVQTVNLKGRGAFQTKIAGRVDYHLKQDRHGDIIGAVGLLDLYGGAEFPPNKTTASERYEWGVQHYEDIVGHRQFRMFFAVHETEAWLLSDPSIFPHGVQDRVQRNCSSHPEHVNFDKPPAKWLNEFYLSATNKAYKKVTDGKNLFARLDAKVVYGKCPYFKRVLDEMLDLARKALKEN